MTHDEVVREITRRAWTFGVPVLISPDRTVPCDGLKVGGYFQEPVDGRPPLLVASASIDSDRALGILLHEYSHLTQWVEQCPVWVAAAADPDWGPWLEGKPVRGVKAIIARCRDMEADCERRTIRLIRELGAPIDLDRHIRGANAYIHFHNVMLDRRKWYKDGLGPYTMPEVLAVANPTFDRDHSKTPKALYNAINARL